MTPSTILPILIGLALLIFISVRQMSWTKVNAASMLKLPMIMALVGLVLAAQTFDHPGALHVHGADLVLIAAEAGVAVVGGLLMGRMTQIDTINGVTQSRLRPAGLAVWFGFIAIRIGGEVLAHADHLALASSTPLILFMVAIVKATQALTVRERVARHEQSRQVAYDSYSRI
ncbi:hypothetical protein FOE78_18035 [Microlunatus elymi]|uniref:DUF1453 domain-containing protein n=1 Tax=Microlunatus elymi TaxID=2596828 RepID=A0A516Q2A0_9ACTN|nr:hypothetical protein [Microlunatus elymi]QDP97560.1 hypothetical protein FOE78_18035 [Microlunatus elymi]